MHINKMHKHIATLTVGRIINSIAGHMNDTHFKMIKIYEMIDDLRIFGGTTARYIGKQVRRLGLAKFILL